jgi:hypothetical protein
MFAVPSMLASQDVKSSTQLHGRGSEVQGRRRKVWFERSVEQRWEPMKKNESRHGRADY